MSSPAVGTRRTADRTQFVHLTAYQASRPHGQIGGRATHDYSEPAGSGPKWPALCEQHLRASLRSPPRDSPKHPSTDLAHWDMRNKETPT
jgi:hypothetical protein